MAEHENRVIEGLTHAMLEDLVKKLAPKQLENQARIMKGKVTSRSMTGSALTSTVGVEIAGSGVTLAGLPLLSFPPSSYSNQDVFVIQQGPFIGVLGQPGGFGQSDRAGYRRSINTSIAHATDTYVIHPVVLYAQGTGVTLASGNNGLKVQYEGLYLAECSVRFAGGGNNAERYLAILVSPAAGGSDVRWTHTSVYTGGTATLSCSTLISCAANDIIRGLVWQFSGGSLTIEASGNTPALHAMHVGWAWDA